MKLVFLFLLVTIPICCYASGSGCSILDEVIRGTINSTVTLHDYMKLVKPYVHDHFTANAVKQFKQCFLDQTNKTVENVGVMTEAIFNSESCQQPS
uniref:Secretoglobin family 2A member 1 n=1 Tax=Rattus norvegicus TaxID=10116 RepID=SG2A1_RAT|nr:RecName: Full=Secretoglobin family 2A member 1; AltName: Full=Prostatic steroid-binding protein C3.2; Flags: Precursor [Rattus norvegicus]CAB75892.1 prostatic steroid binding protein [Rattus norvegicus]